ncbi:hypothetical protein A2422_01310 [Candidatus Woesebacteria bacterium RIFOXYC1_FULL_31_51]|uniref:Peptidase n=1 Tax=Candidatus Woesebacteria bacterium GW2011_GWC2_31_9 TaxID=1618586 RepID=A0A0F9YYP2_9BACT|nr:MAG: dienelactone hydrolase [Candidatus Woesebacteria bacterium GW2011_GWF1_31_35]KKP22676.1 MAG: Peptidase [Candidatus Woesebacteria bacterium GW2011_GWC1_30_29]KKP25941.1 MAG: Peptidase [Candidatus Woesebacteria bacterium GW2011_GWD1_31_12]KKP27167.1 MAG: Peptidase [Candidatus Woesebacteria bacterium GW2011_GWB1_31_29]KKP31546.1 MAG: Peptidase [Candidatus Woesebacteria bacterium GW2011_GWC2_31_9]KKP33958.1 MAG: Peptidase [Candidatus Woesebacteria bacterium GW2011_GWF2_32_16]KKP61815.1 MA
MKNNYQIYLYFLISLVLVSIGWWGSDLYKNYLNKNQELPSWNKPKPLEKYTIENLSKAKVEPSKINITETLVTDSNFVSKMFEFKFDPTLENKNLKKVTGLINIPSEIGHFPIIVLIRGYVDQKNYKTGDGSKRVGEFLSKNGYITIAPDFLGYGGSDSESGNIFESRFQTYVTILTLLKSINKENFSNWDGKNIFIWGHSNGGQIAITTLEITGENYPTVLWAPVTKPFPYSILYYTDESDDHGKFIRNELAKFEDSYDVEKYSLTNYLDRIKAPITLFQGTNDDAVPYNWSENFVKRLGELNVNSTYLIYPKADHNMNPVWGDVIIKTLKVFNDLLEV